MRESTRLPGRPSRRALIIITVVVGALIAVVSLRSPSSSDAPPLLRSCTTPAIAVAGPSSNDPNGRFSITGPASGTYVVTVDAKTATVRGTSASVTPAGARAVAIRDGLSGCGSSGAIPGIGPGTHQVELFRDGVLVAQAPLAIGSP